MPSGHLYAVFSQNTFHDFGCSSTENVFSYSNSLLIFRCKIIFPKVNIFFKKRTVPQNPLGVLDFSQTDKKPTAIHSPVLGKTFSTGSLCSLAVITY